MSVTDDIKARLDIVSYINQYVPLKKQGKYYKAPCPFHGEKTPSFVVNEDRQSWRCFGACAEGGDIFSFAQKYHGWDFKEALRELGDLAGVEVRKQSPEQKKAAERNDLLRGMLNEAAGAFHRKLYDTKDTGAVEALRYAKEKRGLSDETIAAFGIGYAPPGWNNMLGYLTEIGYAEDDIITAGLALRSERTGKLYDRFRNRFMVPIRDQRGRAVGFGGRILDPDDKPKYMNSPQTPVFDKSKLLFGLDLAKDPIRDGETAVIVEGYMDAITAHQAGFTNVVAQMGTAMTDTQLGLIAPKWAKRIVLALDSDAAGQNATLRSLEVARDALKADYSGRMQVDMRVLQIPDAKDPDDLIRENPDGWQTLVDNAMTVADFLIGMEVAQLPQNPTVQDREAVARRVMPLLLATENNLYQKDNVQKLAMRLLLPESDLMRLATEQVKINQARPPKRIKPPVLDDDGDMPPPRTDFDEAPPPVADEDGPPPRDYGDDVQPAQAQPVRRAASLTNDAKVEAHLLHGLIHHPDVYYRVNGKLHEVLLNNETLAPALVPFGVEDFSRTELRELMVLYMEALEQDDMDITAYILTYTDDALTAELEMVLEDRMQAIMQDEKRVARGDLARVMEKIQRSGVIVDPRSDLIARALRMRCRRLMREREELRLVQMNATRSGDHDEADTCADRIDRLARAVHLLEIEEKQVASLY